MFLITGRKQDMRIIRKNSFETNSSSSHSLTLKQNWSFYSQYELKYLKDCYLIRDFDSNVEFITLNQKIELLLTFIAEKYFKDFISNFKKSKKFNSYINSNLDLELKNELESILKNGYLDSESFKIFPFLEKEFLTYLSKHEKVKFIEKVIRAKIKKYDFYFVKEEFDQYKLKEKLNVDLNQDGKLDFTHFKLNFRFENNSDKPYSDEKSSYSDEETLHYGFNDEDRSGGILYVLFSNQELMETFLFNEYNESFYG